ncbi:MAG: type II secretion system protein [bacterium]|nr:type II secretion system protein [bacterium]
MIKQYQNRGFTRATAGFTLVEMMVAVGIFVIVAFIVTTAFLSLADANRKAQNIRLVMDNLNFAIDSMALKMREGNKYNCTTYPECSDLSFIRSDGFGATYQFSAGSGGSLGRILGCKSSDSSSCSAIVPITAPQIDIKKFSVILSGTTPKAALLLIQGTAGSGKTLSTFNIQTTVSERN